jgi:hypothetical protein
MPDPWTIPPAADPNGAVGIWPIGRIGPVGKRIATIPPPGRLSFDPIAGPLRGGGVRLGSVLTEVHRELGAGT